jgi:hypothetical protein
MSEPLVLALPENGMTLLATFGLRKMNGACIGDSEQREVHSVEGLRTDDQTISLKRN